MKIQYGYNIDGTPYYIESNSFEWVKKIGRPSLLKSILKLIQNVDSLADEYLDSIVFYPVNGKYYKPKWADTAGTYWGLLQLDDNLIKKGQESVFPMIIKDATQLPENFVTMTREELENLIAYLVLKIQENYTEKTNLIGQLRTLEKMLQECRNREVFDQIEKEYNELQIAFDNRNVEPEIPAAEDEPEIIDKTSENGTIEENNENQEISENEN